MQYGAVFLYCQALLVLSLRAKRGNPIDLILNVKIQLTIELQMLKYLNVSVLSFELCHLILFRIQGFPFEAISSQLLDCPSPNADS